MKPVRTCQLVLAAALVAVFLIMPTGMQNQTGDSQANFEGPGSSGNR